MARKVSSVKTITDVFNGWPSSGTPLNCIVTTENSIWKFEKLRREKKFQSNYRKAWTTLIGHLVVTVLTVFLFRCLNRRTLLINVFVDPDIFDVIRLQGGKSGNEIWILTFKRNSLLLAPKNELQITSKDDLPTNQLCISAAVIIKSHYRFSYPDKIRKSIFFRQGGPRTVNFFKRTWY